MKTKTNKRITAFIVALALIISCFGGYRIYKQVYAAEFDTSTAVTFAEFKRTHTIPDTTIFIGTHLIALESATDELWELADNSKDSSNQMNEYYKSELKNGVWVEISDGAGIADISDEGIPVDEAELDDLYVQYYTFQLGITRSAKDDSRHCIFDGEYPYWDLYHLPELVTIRDQYDMLVSRNLTTSRMDRYYRWLLSGFFNMNLRNEYTDDCDNKLYALQDVYDALMGQDREEDAQVIYKLMAKLDHMRRAEIFRQLAIDEDLDILNNLHSRASGSDYYDEDIEEDDDDYRDFIVNNEITDAITYDNDQCDKAYNEHSTDVLEQEGGRVIDECIYNYSISIIDGAPNGYNPSMDENITKLRHIFNIDESAIIDSEGELNELNTELIPKIQEKFRIAVNAGESDTYRTAKAGGATAAELDSIRKVDESVPDSVRNELQKAIKAKTDRQSSTDGMAFTLERINWTYDIKKNIGGGDFKVCGVNQTNLHIDWLMDLLKDLIEKGASAQSLLDKLNSQYDDLALKRQMALDDNDLARAREYEAAMNALADKIDDENSRLQDVLDDPNASAADKAMAQALMNGNSMQGLVNTLKNDALNSILDGTGLGEGADSLKDLLDLLASLGALDALHDLKNQIDNAGAGSDALNGMLNDAINNAGGNAGMGEGEGGSLSEDELLALLSRMLGDIDSLSDGDLAGAIRALELLGRDGNINALYLAGKLASRAAANDNIYVYTRLVAGSNYEYVMLRTLAKVAGYRYVFETKNNKEQIATLAKNNKAKTFTFLIGESKIGLSTGKVDLPDINRVFRYPYAVCDAAKTYFNCTACDITKSGYGICLTSKLEDKAQDLYNQLKEAM